MRVLEGRHDGRQLVVDVVVAEPGYRHSLRLITGRGLVDTGASTSLITQRFADELDLPRRGRHPLVSVHGIQLADRYDFRLGFVMHDGLDARSPFVLDLELSGSAFVSHGNFDVIIGMDVLRTGTLTVRADANFSFAF